MVKKKRRLKNKIIAVMLPITLLLIIVNSIYHYNVMKKELIENFKVSQVNAEAHILDTLYLIDAGYRMLEIKLESDLNERAEAFLSTYIQANGKLSQADLEKLKNSFGNEYDFLIIDSETTIIQSTIVEGLGFNFTKFSPELGKKINGIRQGDVTWFEQLRTNVATGRLSKFAYVPSPDHKYLLEVAYSIDGFTHIIEELKPHSIMEQMIDVSPQIKDIKIYDVYGYVYSDSGEKAEPHADLLQLIKRVKEEKEVTIEVNTVTSKKYLYVDLNQYRKKTLADTDRIIEIVYDKMAVINSLRDLGFSTVMGILIISAFLILSIYYISYRLTRPIETFRKGAEKIAEGDYASRIMVLSNDEIGELAEAFNHMVEQLSMSFSKIEGQNAILEDYNRNLERMAKDRDEEVEARNFELEEQNKALELWQNKVREMKTPLEAIISMTRMMFGTSLESQQRELLSKIQRSVESLIKNLGDTGEFSNGKDETVKLEPTLFYLDEIFEWVTHQVAFKATENNIKLLFSNDPSTQLQLMGEPSRLKQVLFNLVSQSIEFTDKESVIVETQLAGENEDEIKIRFSVREVSSEIKVAELERFMSEGMWMEGALKKDDTFYFTGIFGKAKSSKGIT